MTRPPGKPIKSVPRIMLNPKKRQRRKSKKTKKTQKGKPPKPLRKFSRKF